MLKFLLFISLALATYQLSYTGVLKVGQQGSGKNPLFFSVSGHCTVNSGSATLKYKVESGWVKIDGQKHSSGYSGQISVSAGQTYSGEVSGHAEGWGENMGPDDLNVTCTGDLADALTLIDQGFSISELITEDVTIAVGQSASYKNPMFFSVSATCKATCTQSVPIAVHDNSGDITVNNQKMTKGGSYTVTVANGESVYMHISGHADASIENKGTVPLSLACSIDLASDYIAYKLAKVE